MTPHVPSRKRAGLWTAALASLVAVGLSGCLGAGEAEMGNERPEAVLTVNRGVAWSGEELVFDARDSNDPDGNITSYRFDFGDGTILEVQKEADARMTHAYRTGGEYTATLTVLDDGDRKRGSLSDTADVEVVINERKRIPEQVLYAAPANNSPAASSRVPFDADDGADRFELNVTVSSVLLVGSSEVRVRVLDPEGAVMEEGSVVVAPGENKSVALAGDIDRTGLHTVELSARSGGANVTGEVRILYSEGEGGG